MVPRRTLDNFTTEDVPAKIAALRELFALRADAKKVRRAANDFNMIVDNLPPCVELRIMHGTPVSKRRSGALQNRFNEKYKRNFYLRIAEDADGQEALHSMGIPRLEILFMAQNGVIPKSESERWTYDMSVDHIRETRMGGTNEYENFCIIPRYLNMLKSSLIMAQRNVNGLRAEMLTFVPKPIDGVIPAVPHIPGGFVKMNLDDQRAYTRERTNEFLGVKFY